MMCWLRKEYGWISVLSSHNSMLRNLSITSSRPKHFCSSYLSKWWVMYFCQDGTFSSKSHYFGALLQDLACDFAGSLSKTKSGHRFIFMVMCLRSSYPYCVLGGRRKLDMNSNTDIHKKWLQVMSL